MRIEACFSPEANLVRLRHIRSALGTRVDELDVVEVVIVAGVVARQRVELVRKVSGRGRHVAFQCPRCLEPRAVLHAEGGGRLSCARCSGYKTRHQRESSRTEWEKSALDHEDRLFRAVMRKNHTPTGMKSLHRLVNEIVAGDYDRLAAVVLVTTAALLVADVEIHLAAD